MISPFADVKAVSGNPAQDGVDTNQVKMRFTLTEYIENWETENAMITYDTEKKQESVSFDQSFFLLYEEEEFKRMIMINRDKILVYKNTKNDQKLMFTHNLEFNILEAKFIDSMWLYVLKSAKINLSSMGSMHTM